MKDPAGAGAAAAVWGRRLRLIAEALIRARAGRALDIRKLRISLLLCDPWKGHEIIGETETGVEGGGRPRVSVAQPGGTGEVG